MKMLQVRNVPDDLHRALKERAARDGTTMSELVLAELPRIAGERSPAQVLAAIRALPPVTGVSSVDLVASGRAER